LQGVEQLTAAFSSEIVPAFVNPHTGNLWQFANCNAAMTSCSIAGTPNSFNPFKEAFGLVYSDTVGGVARGEITGTQTTSVYGFEQFGFGFDTIDVPVNDIAGGGSTGATKEGMFWLDVDYSLSFEMEIYIELKNASGYVYSKKKHTYTFDSANCSFTYTVEEIGTKFFARVLSTIHPSYVANNATFSLTKGNDTQSTPFADAFTMGTAINAGDIDFVTANWASISSTFFVVEGNDKEAIAVTFQDSNVTVFNQGTSAYTSVTTMLSFLSGGLNGWITPSCGASGNPNDDPIVTQALGILQAARVVPVQVFDFATTKTCCYFSPVFAHLVDTDSWKNDVNSFILKRDFASETIDLVLLKDGGLSNGGTDIPLIDNTYGTYYDFGNLSNSNYKGYQIEWQKVLQVEGEGSYQLQATSTLISGVVTEFSLVFKLKSYTEEAVKGTVRVQSIMNGFLRHTGFNYKGLQWKDGIRVRGMFGNRQAEYEQEQIIYTNRNSVQLRSEMINNYVLETSHIPSCVTDLFIEYHNFANHLLITDYNPVNHVKTYVDKKVVFDSMEEIDYKGVTDRAPLRIKYKDFTQNFLKSNC
jgi:hypothetical protein